MFISIFNFEVAPEKQEAFLKAANEKIKPYWESHGTWAYNVYQEWDAEKGEPGTHFVKTQIIDGMPPKIEEARAKRSEEAKAVVELFYSFVTDLSFKTYIKKI